MISPFHSPAVDRGCPAGLRRSVNIPLCPKLIEAVEAEGFGGGGAVASVLVRLVALDLAQVAADPRSRRRRTLHPDQ